MKPYLKYPGGKGHLRSFFNHVWTNSHCNILVESHYRSLADMFQFNPRTALINDTKEYVVYFHQPVVTGGPKWT